MLLDVKPINELYIGKTKELLEMEKLLGKFRSKHMGPLSGLDIKINNDPDLLKFNRMMESFFGFGCFCLNIINSSIVNAFTIPLSIRYDIAISRKNMIVDKAHLRYNPDADLSCITFIYSGIILNDMYSDAEVMSVILHEIGHNFSIMMDNSQLVFSYVRKVCIIYSIIISLLMGNLSSISSVLLLSNNIATATLKTERQLRENKSFLINLFDIIEWLHGILESYKYNVQKYMDFFTLGAFRAVAIIQYFFNSLLNPLGLILPYSYRDEMNADNFATIFGYGAETISVQEKLESKTADPDILFRELNKIPLISQLAGLISLVPDILISCVNSHPTGLVRMRDQLDLLEREVRKNNIDPKMKKSIESDIKACKKELNKAYDVSKGIQDPDLIRHFYYKILHELSGDMTFKALIFKDKNKFEKYDQMYEEAKKNKNN